MRAYSEDHLKGCKTTSSLSFNEPYQGAFPAILLVFYLNASPEIPFNSFLMAPWTGLDSFQPLCSSYGHLRLSVNKS